MLDRMSKFWKRRLKRRPASVPGEQTKPAPAAHLPTLDDARYIEDEAARRLRVLDKRLEMITHRIKDES